jgi:hypothetical protein
MGAVLQYRLSSETRWSRVNAAPDSSIGCDAVWSVTLQGLAPRSRYVYRVSGAAADGRVWSDRFKLYTGPTDRRHRYKFAFLASNGLASTPWSPQAANVIAQVKAGGFPLVLGGGGYTLSAEAIAAGVAADADQAVHMWKRQSGGVTANSIFVPVLGDTEVESFAHAETSADYAEYLAGALDGARAGPSRSFDFNGAHFVALHAPTLGSVHPSTSEGAANLAWLDADLAAARAAGARWIVVYMHTDLFSSERSNAQSATARHAFGEIALRHRVNVVLSGDDDSYERSRALRGDLATPTAGAITSRVSTARDGIVFVRAGSGGRTAFGSWLNATPPGWSAVRNNSRAVFLSVTVDGDYLGVVANALDASGKKYVIDSVGIR